MDSSGNDLFSLDNKTILITRSTRGIGQGISLCFARLRAKVMANYLRNEGSAEELRAIAERKRPGTSKKRLAIRKQSGRTDCLWR
jgi:NAD(P)-dependent dehydrogenase (short-subunit alcohol dehydrogenase family)